MEKKSPLDAVVEEMSLTSELTPNELRDSIVAIMDHLRTRAKGTLDDDSVSDETALQYAQQYLAFTQLVAFYGTALIACEDIEEENLPN